MSLFSTPNLNEKREKIVFQLLQTKSLAAFSLISNNQFATRDVHLFARVAKYLENELKIQATLCNFQINKYFKHILT